MTGINRMTIFYTTWRDLTLMVILAHKVALNPTRSQERLLWEHVGYARFAANRAIEDFRDGLDDGEWRNDRVRNSCRFSTRWMILVGIRDRDDEPSGTIVP